MQFGSIKKYAPHLVWLFFAYMVYQYFKELRIGGGSPWITGDWLINYSGGPVRRGLIGTVLLGISQSGLPLLWVIYLTQISIYATTIWMILKIYNLTERNISWMLLLFSPAFIVFPFHDMQGAFRKESIAFLAFSYLALNYSKKNIGSGKLIITTAIFLIASLSHEVSSFTLPFFIYLIIQSFKNNFITRAAAISTIFGLIAIAIGSLAFAYWFRGDQDTINSICRSIISQGFNRDVCDGAISWLNEDSNYGFYEFNIDIIPYIKIYLALLFISLSPFFLISPIRWQFITISIVGFIFILPLMFVAVDWGRWLYIYIFFISCIVLSESIHYELHFKKVPIILVLAYALSWNIPHCCKYKVGDGVLFRGYHYFQRILNGPML